MAFYNHTFRDFYGKTSSVRVQVDPTALEADYRLALLAVTFGQAARYAVIAEEDVISTASAPTDNIKAGDGMRIYMSDNVTGDEFFFTIPMPDTGVWVGVPNSAGLQDLTQPAAVTTFITYLNTHVLSPLGNAATVQRAVAVSRNR